MYYSFLKTYFLYRKHHINIAKQTKAIGRLSKVINSQTSTSQINTGIVVNFTHAQINKRVKSLTVANSCQNY